MSRDNVGEAAGLGRFGGFWRVWLAWTGWRSSCGRGEVRSCLGNDVLFYGSLHHRDIYVRSIPILSTHVCDRYSFTGITTSGIL